MKFLLTLMLISCSAVALAQSTAEPSLFPELDVLKKTTEDNKVNTSEAENTVSMNSLEENKDTSGISEQAAPDNSTPPNLEGTDSSSEMPQKSEESQNDEEKKEEEQNIIVFLDDIDITLTPNRSGSFCSAKFGILNGTKKTLKEFSGTLVINQIRKDFNYSNTKSNAANGNNYIFIGHDCEQLMDPPELEIKKCKIDGWSEKKCKESIVFFATSNQQNNAQ